MTQEKKELKKEVRGKILRQVVHIQKRAGEEKARVDNNRCNTLCYCINNFANINTSSVPLCGRVLAPPITYIIIKKRE